MQRISHRNIHNDLLRLYRYESILTAQENRTITFPHSYRFEMILYLLLSLTEANK